MGHLPAKGHHAARRRMTQFTAAPPCWRRRLLDLLLLPLALLAILLEDLLWRGAKWLLGWINALPAAGRLRTMLGRLPGWAALPLFLIPELAARLGDIWFAVLLVEGRVVSAAAIYAVVRVISTLVAVFIWQACSVALLRMGWFARLIAWIEAARDWALALSTYLRERVRYGGALTLRVRLLQRAVLGWFHRI